MFSQFLGLWHVIQTSGIDIPCASYNVEESSSGLHNYKVTVQPANLNLELSPKKGRDLTEGFLEKSPLPLLNNANLRIFETDYDSYAGVIECNDNNGIFYLSTTLASRSKTLSDDVIAKLKAKLAGFGIDVSTLKTVDHTICV